MRSFVAYWYEHQKELSACDPYEWNAANLEHVSVFPGGEVTKALPFKEGVLFTVQYKAETRQSFIPWQQLSSLDFN